MDSESKILHKTLGRAVSGEGAHAGTEAIFAGLDWQLAGIRPERAPHTVFELLNHMVFWQDWAIRWFAGGSPPIPQHASGSWPGASGPASEEAWQAAVECFRKGLEALAEQSREADLFARHGNKSRLEMLQTMAAHNSYHAGQVVLLRQMLGAWPPPSGGLTW
jgi:uncharacterized damage-inducible protein DinB